MTVFREPPYQQKHSYATVLHHLLRWAYFGETAVKQVIVVKAGLWVEDMKDFGKTHSNLLAHKVQSHLQ